MPDTQVSSVVYNGKKLIPAPFLGFNKTYRNTADGTQIGTDLTVTLTGKMVACKGWDFTSGTPELYSGGGYPADSSNCCKFQNLLDMQEKLREHFKVGQDYHWFEVAYPSRAPKKWRARVKDVNIKEGNWVEYFEYTITLDLQSEVDADNYLQFNENWDVKFSEENGNVYDLTHTISCQSKEFATEGSITDGWQKAREWLSTKLAGNVGADIIDDAASIDEDIVFNNTGLNISDDYDSYNYNRQEVVNIYDGTLSITESWVLSKNPIIKKFVIQVEETKGNDIVIKLSGEFRGLINTDRNNNDAVKTEFDTFAPYDLVNTYYHGSKTLGQCPSVKSITYNKASSGDDNISTETTRTISFSYEFSDGIASGGYETELTISEKIQLTGECARVVSVEGNIQGISCGNNSMYTNATAAFTTNFTDNLVEVIALSIYTGNKTLTLVNKSVGKNERKGSIVFGFEYSDLYSNKVKIIETVSESWSCEKRGSNGQQTRTISINGSIEGVGVCSPQDFSSYVLSEIPTDISIKSKYSDVFSGGATFYLIRQTKSRDDVNHKVGYDFEFEEDAGSAITTISATLKVGPDRCQYKYITVQFEILGRGCSNAIALVNAQNAVSTAESLSLAKAIELGGNSQTLASYSKTVSDIGKISGTYEYNNLGNAETIINITESRDVGDCGYIKRAVNGNIKGKCTSNSTAIENARYAYSQISITTYIPSGHIISSSKTENEYDGTINFQFEGNTRDENFIEEQNITISSSLEKLGKTIRISGTITPLCSVDCITQETPLADACISAQVERGELAWNTIRDGLSGRAVSIFEGIYGIVQSVIEKSSSVTKGTLNGRINYDYEFEVRFVSINNSNVYEDFVEITKKNQSKIIAQIPVLGRAIGPVVQDKSTQSGEVYTINYSAKLYPTSITIILPEGISAACFTLIKNVLLSSNYEDRLFHKIDDVEGWSPKMGRYTRQVSFVRERES